MADLTEHCATSLRLLGRDFAEVHAFIDQFFPKYSMSHRHILHHQLGVELIAAQFGEEVRAAAELHIIEDLMPGVELDQDWQTLRGQILATWLPYGEPLFVDLALYDELAQELLNIYGEDLVRTVEKGAIPASEITLKLNSNPGGLYLRGIRYRDEITQEQLSLLTGIPRRHLSEMENGKRPIGKESAKKLAATLNCDYQRLL